MFPNTPLDAHLLTGYKILSFSLFPSRGFKTLEKLQSKSDGFYTRRSPNTTILPKYHYTYTGLLTNPFISIATP